jgi:hypothetical protein
MHAPVEERGKSSNLLISKSFGAQKTALDAELEVYQLRQVLEAQTQYPEDKVATFNVVAKLAAHTRSGR